MMKLNILLGSLLLFGCSTQTKVVELNELKSFYRPSLEHTKTVESDDNQYKKASFSVSDMDFRSFITLVSDKYNVGIVYSDDLDSHKVSAEFKDAGIYEIVNTLSRRYQKDISRVYNTFFIGKGEPEDRGVLVRKVKGLSSEDMNTILEAIAHEKNRGFVTNDSQTTTTFPHRRHLFFPQFFPCDFSSIFLFSIARLAVAARILSPSKCSMIEY